MATKFDFSIVDNYDHCQIIEATRTEALCKAVRLSERWDSEVTVYYGNINVDPIYSINKICTIDAS